MKGDGTGSFSIYGDKFSVRVLLLAHSTARDILRLLIQDENFQEKHVGPGLLSMVSRPISTPAPCAADTQPQRHRPTPGPIRMAAKYVLWSLSPRRNSGCFTVFFCVVLHHDRKVRFPRRETRRVWEGD
jgi:hypothetical protein